MIITQAIPRHWGPPAGGARESDNAVTRHGESSLDNTNVHAGKIGSSMKIRIVARASCDTGKSNNSGTMQN